LQQATNECVGRENGSAGADVSVVTKFEPGTCRAMPISWRRWLNTVPQAPRTLTSASFRRNGGRFAPDAGKHRFEIVRLSRQIFRNKRPFPDVQRMRHAFHFDPLTVLLPELSSGHATAAGMGSAARPRIWTRGFPTIGRIIAGGTHNA